MKRVLVAYATYAGSTPEVAHAVGQELAKRGLTVDVLPVGEVGSLDGYDSVVVGGPMILGWHRAALGFFRRHRRALQRIPVAAFVTAMSLTQTVESHVGGVPIYLDERLPKPLSKEGHRTLKERYADLRNYVRPIISAAGPRKPVSIGVFGGRLEYGRLKPWAVVFVMVILKAPPGDLRNWTAIRSWASTLPEALGL
jgi:menaquinone-dependent protoporphyrinogen oxidase